ncbi:Enamine/imine deaminase [Anaerohalosphaera lusitana]|uniref:Enamine/imine deaminase n=1 Tax=Anaerohalosphaera lusitana TaxID=1936003 RepID=A0A1U9NNN8_9BACT|nr:RidA family protein [Anaerohalosphaera lusitana]AQT69230.1 Enamine/imine deaminase [Anaerohalosphaera lusitana]
MKKQRKIIKTTKAPQAIGPYSQALLVDDSLYISGQLGLDPSTGEIVGESVASQTHQVFKNIVAILGEADMALENVVQCQVFLSDMGDFAEVNAVYAEYFPENPPTRAAFEVSQLPAGGKVEILATAVK